MKERLDRTVHDKYWNENHKLHHAKIFKALEEFENEHPNPSPVSYCLFYQYVFECNYGLVLGNAKTSFSLLLSHRFFEGWLLLDDFPAPRGRKNMRFFALVSSTEACWKTNIKSRTMR